jgi:23S rRNA (cytidine1920-2'-O)/16S rRNA (cytidine1409-2'-O)-methyltransferase
MREKKEKKRLDTLLVEKELFETRQKAQAAIMAGVVYVNGNKETKSGTKFSQEVLITVKDDYLPFVSRGGLKLAKALDVFNIDLKDRICIDAGASTGGFTDCLLQNGAAMVYAVDVGYGQLDWKLRNDPRVKVIERTNIRYLTPEKLYNDEQSIKASLATIDLSFISVTKVIISLVSLMSYEKHLIILIKPQFEAGRERVTKSGVVKDNKTHISVISTIFDFCKNLELYPVDLTYSPVKGPSGNIEYLGYVTGKPAKDLIDNTLINSIVEKAHKDLD